MHRTPILDRHTAARAIRPILTLALLTVLTGCSNWTYRHLQIGQTPHEYRRVLPTINTDQTPATVCYLKRQGSDRRDALVVLLTVDRRLAGKLRASYRQRKNEFTYRLDGKIDPRLYGTEDAGITNTLRALAIDLTEHPGRQLAVEVHTWVAAGIVRLLAESPETGDFGVSAQQLQKLFERVPAGGQSQLKRSEQGYIELEYKVVGSTDGDSS